jgi:hypothetical protein
MCAKLRCSIEKEGTEAQNINRSRAQMDAAEGLHQL